MLLDGQPDVPSMVTTVLGPARYDDLHTSNYTYVTELNNQNTYVVPIGQYVQHSAVVAPVLLLLGGFYVR